MHTHRLFEGGYYQYAGWLRIKGYGLHIRRSKGFVPKFSEREGYVKPWYVLGLRIEVLKPNDWRTR